MRKSIFELEDVVVLLRSEIERAGGPLKWSKKTGINRAVVYKTLNDIKPPNKSIIRALKLRTVFVAESRKSKR
jgi:DNA-binding phage protein